MKNLIILFLFSLTLFSCMRYDPDYTYSYDIEVTYQNGDIDTIHHDRESFKGNPVGIYIKTAESGLISSASVDACLTSYCGFYSTTITCGVRKFNIFNETKVKVDPPKYRQKR